MAIQGVTFDKRSEITENSLNLMRDYIWCEELQKYTTVVQPSHQYLIEEADQLEPEFLENEEIESDYLVLEEIGNDINKGRIQPEKENIYRIAYRNGEIVEKEIEWEEAESIISA